ncbi:phospholipid scramblase 1-like [Tubulanus polymorphus]|uniref:phospholipid scramblase 1-like n=1 Tax=Tubulanus polymorphus TaxID=672921 RepID=UPI003DA437A8
MSTKSGTTTTTSSEQVEDSKKVPRRKKPSSVNYEKNTDSKQHYKSSPVLSQPASIPRHKKKSLSSFDPIQHAKPGIPKGLEYLSILDKLTIYQYLDVVQATTCWVRSNKHRICNDHDQQFFLAKEAEGDDTSTDAYCCSLTQSYITNIDNNNGHTIVRLDRKRSPCSDHMSVECPPGTLIGHIRLKVLSCTMYPVFKILDPDLKEIYAVQVPVSYCTSCCSDLVYKITSLEGCDNAEIGEIRRMWTGCKVMPASDFSVKFPEDLDVLRKSLFLAVTLFIDNKLWETIIV